MYLQFLQHAGMEGWAGVYLIDRKFGGKLVAAKIARPHFAICHERENYKRTALIN